MEKCSKFRLLASLMLGLVVVCCFFSHTALASEQKVKTVITKVVTVEGFIGIETLNGPVSFADSMKADMSLAEGALLFKILTKYWKQKIPVELTMVNGQWGKECVKVKPVGSADSAQDQQLVEQATQAQKVLSGVAKCVQMQEYDFYEGYHMYVTDKGTFQIDERVNTTSDGAILEDALRMSSPECFCIKYTYEAGNPQRKEIQAVSLFFENQCSF